MRESEKLTFIYSFVDLELWRTQRLGLISLCQNFAPSPSFFPTKKSFMSSSSPACLTSNHQITSLKMWSNLWSVYLIDLIWSVFFFCFPLLHFLVSSFTCNFIEFTSAFFFMFQLLIVSIIMWLCVKSIYLLEKKKELKKETKNTPTTTTFSYCELTQ